MIKSDGITDLGVQVMDGPELTKFIDNLDDITTRWKLRKAALARWSNKFDSTFFTHVEGEFTTRIFSSRRINFKTEALQSVGGHRLSDNLKVTQIDIPPGAYIDSVGNIVNLPNDAPFKGNVEIKYRDGFLPKKDKSSLFPKNWTLERIQGEIAIAYDYIQINEIKPFKKREFSQYRYFSDDNQILILLEVDITGIIKNAYPQIR